MWFNPGDRVFVPLKEINYAFSQYCLAPIFLDVEINSPGTYCPSLLKNALTFGWSPLYFKESMQQDVNAVRELCVKLDQARDSLTRQITTKTEDETRVCFSAFILTFAWLLTAKLT